MSRWWRKRTKIPSWEPTYPLEKQYWRWCSFPKGGICFLSLEGITWKVETWIEVHKLCHRKLAWKLNMSTSEEGTSWNHEFWGGLYTCYIGFLWFSIVFWDAPLLVRGLTLKPTGHISCSAWRLTRCPPSWCPLPCRGTWRWKMDSGILNHMHIYIYRCTGWWFQIFFYVHPYLGKWSNLTNIFQMGWNHQPVYHVCNVSCM